MAQEPISDNKYGHCIYCNACCYIECCKCYTTGILKYQQEIHNCPDGEDNNDTDIEVCERIKEF
jgi:hypothetical protein